jgi:hypothetical protein
MPAVDRNILRISAFELLWQESVPDAVAISEGVLLARDLSTDGSSSFVNGLLARLLELKPGLPLQVPEAEPAEAAEAAEATEPAETAAPAAAAEAGETPAAP